ncbi:MAG: T9SS type A sorting domain-containing protein [candidate division WOR-3 bacterium]|nr:MAG: T9SS type A sorting domain-containing protein [candidate division WOR-3 bacterium]
MKYLLNTCVILLCVVSLSAAFTNPYSKANTEQSQPVTRDISEMVRYKPALRQNDVLFVEDKAGTFGPVAQPDPLWDSLLTELIGTGNFGWFTTPDEISNGPDLATMEQYELIIWNCYDYWWSSPDPAALTTDDMQNISDLLFGGGKVWLIGQDVLWSGVPAPWMDTHFHLTDANQDYNYGIDSAHVHGLDEINCFSMTVISDYASNPLYTDELFPDAAWGCHSVLEDVDSMVNIAIFYPGIGDWQSSFWAIDLRDASFTYWTEITSMVSGMFEAFGLTGVSEMPANDPARAIQLSVSPDPFVRFTTISFNIPASANVALKIYNNAGQYVNTLVEGRQNAGSYSITWDRKDSSGSVVSSGVYFVRLTSDDIVSSASIVVAK